MDQIMKAGNGNFIQQYKFQLLYSVLFIHWIIFFQFGNIDYSAFDWYCIHQWTDVAKLSLAEGRIPYEAQLWDPASPGSTLFGQRYFAIPFLIISPQILLLKWVSVSAFMIIQVLVTFSIGYYFLVKWCRKFQFSEITAGFLIFSWVLNGALIGRMGVGHIQLAGYFLIPGFIYILHTFISTPVPRKTFTGLISFSVPMALYLFLILIQGSVFAVYQMVIILGVTSLFFFKRMKYIVFTLLLFVLLASYFLYPNAMFGEYGDRDAKLRIVFAGYSWGGLYNFFEQYYHGHVPVFVDKVFHKLYMLALNPFLKIPLNLILSCLYVLIALVIPFYPSQDATWESSAYIGPVGFLIMAAGLYFYIQKLLKKQVRFHLKETLIVLIVFLLSIWTVSGVLFGLLQKIIPINAIDRLPTRFFMYPLFVLLIVACINLEKSSLLERIKANFFYRSVLITAFLLPLLLNSYHWSATEVSKGSMITENVVRNSKPAFATRILDSANTAYIHTVNVSLLITFTSLVICCFAYFYFKNKMHKYENTF